MASIAVCFATLFPAVLIIPQESTFGQVLSFYLAGIGVYSPVLAGMLVARFIRPARQRVALSKRMLVFMPAWLIAAIIRSASLSLTTPPSTPLILLFVLSLPVALLPAYVVSSAFHGTDGVRQLLKTLVRPQGSIGYYLLASLTFPLIHILDNGITNILRGDTWVSQVGSVPDLTSAVFVTFFSALLFSGGINEERES